MTNLDYIKLHFPVGTKVEAIHNRIVCFEGEVIGYEEDDFNPSAICKSSTGETRYYSHSEMIVYRSK